MSGVGFSVARGPEPRRSAVSGPAAALVAALFMGCGAPPTPSTTPAKTVARPAAASSLSNGLRLHVEATSGGPAVLVQLWMPAGSMHDPVPGAAALAARSTGDRLAAALAPLGGRAEAWIRPDATIIELQAPATELRFALGELARVVTTSADAATMAASRETVAAMAAAAARSGRRSALQRTVGVTWTGHPAAAPALGPDAPPVEAAERFRAERYEPAGAVLVAVGDLERGALVDAAKASLGAWRGAPPAGRLGPPPSARGPTVVVDAATGPGRIRIALPVAVDTPAAAATADLFAHWLGNDPQGPLQSALRRADVSAKGQAFVYAPGPAGLVVVAVDGITGSVDAAWNAALDALREARQRRPDDPRIEALAARLAAAADGAAGPSGRASAVGARALRWGDPAAWIAAMRAVDGDALDALAGSALAPGAMTAVVFEGGDLDPTLRAEQLRESVAAIDGPPPRPASLPGVTVQVVPRPGAGVVAAHVRIAGGEAAVPDPLAGVARLSARLLARPLAGATLTVTPTRQAIEATLTAPVARFPAALDGLLDRIARPRLSAAAHETARAEALAPGKAAVGRRAAHLLDTAVGRAQGAERAPAEAVAEGLERLPPARLSAWYDAHVTRAPLRITFVGEISEAEALRLVGAALPAERPAVEMRPAASPEPVADDAPAVTRVARRVDGADAAWAVGWALGRTTDDDVGALEVALASVATGLGPELNVDSGVVSGPDAGRAALVISGPADDVRRAVPRVIAGLERLAQVAPDTSAADAAVRWRVGRQAVHLADVGAMAAWVGANAHAGRTFVGQRAFEQWRGALERARSGPVLAASRAHLPFARRIEVWVGPGAAPKTPDPPPVQPEAAPDLPTSRAPSAAGVTLADGGAR